MATNEERTNAEDHAFEMLRASDPAAGAPDPDLSWVRTRVLAKAAAAERQGSQRQWWKTPLKVVPVAVAASCALAVGAGGLGYSLGAEKQETVVAAGEIAKGDSPAMGRPNVGGPEIGATRPGPSATTDSAMSVWGGWSNGRALYIKGWNAEPDSVSEAEAFYYVPLSDAEAESRLLALAEALGIKGKLNKTYYGDWIIEAPRGLEYLNFSRNGSAGNFFYTDESLWQICMPIEEPAISEPSGPELSNLLESPAPARDSSPNGMPSEACGPGEDDFTATEEGSLATAQRILEAAGLSADDYTWTTDLPSGAWVADYDASGDVWVNATPKAGDTEAVWTFHFYNDDKPVSINGDLSRLEPLGVYPIISPDEAIERLNDPRFGPLSGPWAYATPDMSIAQVDPMPEPGTAGGIGGGSGAYPGDMPSPVPSVGPGDQIPWPVQTFTVTDASLELARYYYGADMIIVPVYSLTLSDGGGVKVLAVADTGLATDSE